MNIVADTNTFIAVALNEPEKELIIRLSEGCDLVAPEVLPFEIGNALTAMMNKSALKTHEVDSAWEMVQHIPVDLRRIDIKSALKIATQFNIYAYDAYFLECAISLRSPLLTLDRVLKRIAMDRIAMDLGLTILE
ncbi:MAG: type II toxin-antitoxin system VapC family toxin [Deltaproteobacteria bacterium]|nr:type II toxin-antitoxin system VapC family toxin [Deltaproteobacteria bacterium]